jgi:hypothetical protein
MMNCPKCGSAISKLGRYCGSCKYDFGEELFDKLTFYFGLKDELSKLTKLQNTLYVGIANVSAKIQRYEEVLRRDLERPVVSPKPARKKPVPMKKKRR